LLLRAIAGGLAVIVIALAALVGRLAYGPVSLTGFAPMIKERLAAVYPDSTVDLEALSLAWSTAAGGPMLRADGVSVRAADGRDVLTLPVVDLGLDLAALLRGRVAVETVVLHGAAVVLPLTFGGSADGPMLAPPATLADLRRFVFVDATLVVHDRRTDQTITVAVPEASIVRDGAAAYRFDIRAGIADGGPGIDGNGTVTVADGAITVAGEATIDDLAAADLARYWPAGVAPEAGAWVAENITAGVIDRATVQVAATVRETNPTDPELETLEGTFSYRDLEVHALRPLPPIAGITGTATVTPSQLSLSVARGAWQGLAVADATVTVSGLDAAAQRLAVDAGVSGPLAAAVALLRQPRLGLDLADVRPEQVRGSIATRLTVALPLVADVDLAAVEIDAAGRITEGALTGLRPGLELTGANLAVDLGPETLRLHGPLVVNGAAATLDWRDSFAGAGRPGLQVRARIDRLSQAGREALGMSLDPHLTGPTTVDVTVDLDHAGTGTVALDVDLLAAVLAVPEVAWDKPAGTAGRLRATMTLAGHAVAAVPEVSVQAPGLDVAGALSLDAAAGTVRGATLSRLTIGDTVLDAVDVQRSANGIAVRIGGGTLDARPFLGDGETVGGAGADVSLDAPRLQRVLLGDGRSLRDASLRLVRMGGTWREIAVTGAVHAGPDAARLGNVDVRLGPPAAGELPVAVTAEPVGALAAGLDASPDLRGGRLRFTGDAATAADPLQTFRGTLVVEDLTVLSTSPGRRALATVDAPDDMGFSRGESMTLDRIEATGHKRGAIITIDRLTARDGRNGIVASGTLDLETRAVDLRGRIVPLRAINAVLGRIPILGQLFGGRDGLFAIEMTVTGTIEDPAFRTQILRSLTPDLLAPFEALIPDAAR
jgi:hypothetical protein